MAYLQMGSADRSLAAVARTFGVSRAAVQQQAVRHAWDQRATAFDAAAHPPVAETLAALQPVVAGQAEDLEAEHLAALAEFRDEAERLGKAHTRLSRGLTQAAAKTAARILASETPLSVREVSQLAATAAALATSGLATWGRSIGVDQLLAQVQQNAIAAAQVEVLPN